MSRSKPITKTRTLRSLSPALFAGAAAAALLAAACEADTAVDPDAGPPATVSTDTETEAAADPTPAATDPTPAFTPFEVAPDVRNRTQVQQALQAEYPALLRDAGIGGRVIVWFYVNEAGEAEHVLVAEASGHAGLDEAALRVARQFEFTPALNRGQVVPVWIQIPITFQTR